MHVLITGYILNSEVCVEENICEMIFGVWPILEILAYLFFYDIT